MSSAFSGAACKQPHTAAAIKQHIQGTDRSLVSNYPEVVNLPFNRQALPDGFNLYPAPRPVADSNDTIWVLLQGGNVVLVESASGLALPEGVFPDWPGADRTPLHFASLHSRPVCAVSVPAAQPLPSGLVAEPFNAFQERIPADIMTMAGIAKHLLHWQVVGRFCSRCSGPLAQLPDSWGKRCDACSTEQYPPIHPCAIVLIRRNDQLLLIRKPEWPRGRYSLVAGFLDVGESLEECAIREAREETGITIKNVQYVASQAWPFPSQLMVGFVAEYSSGDIQVDGAEIDDARWFTLGHLPDLPARRSIARFLIDSVNH